MPENYFRSDFWPFQINSQLFFYILFTQWPPSLLIAFLTISDQYVTFYKKKKQPKITNLLILRPCISILFSIITFYVCMYVHGCVWVNEYLFMCYSNVCTHSIHGWIKLSQRDLASCSRILKQRTTHYTVCLQYFGSTIPLYLRCVCGLKAVAPKAY